MKGRLTYIPKKLLELGGQVFLRQVFLDDGHNVTTSCGLRIVVRDERREGELFKLKDAILLYNGRASFGPKLFFVMIGHIFLDVF